MSPQSTRLFNILRLVSPVSCSAATLGYIYMVLYSHTTFLLTITYHKTKIHTSIILNVIKLYNLPNIVSSSYLSKNACLYILTAALCTLYTSTMYTHLQISTRRSKLSTFGSTSYVHIKSGSMAWTIQTIFWTCDNKTET